MDVDYNAGQGQRQTINEQDDKTSINEGQHKKFQSSCWRFLFNVVFFSAKRPRKHRSRRAH